MLKRKKSIKDGSCDPKKHLGKKVLPDELSSDSSYWWDHNFGPSMPQPRHRHSVAVTTTEWPPANMAAPPQDQPFRLAHDCLKAADLYDTTLHTIHEVSMAGDPSMMPGAGSLDDKIRLAASRGQVEMVHDLISQGPMFDTDSEGRNAIHYAAVSGHPQMITLLCQAGCDPNVFDSMGYSALHRAAAQGHLTVVKALCEHGAFTDTQDTVNGNTPLHEAAWNGYSQTVEALIAGKASVSLFNKTGFTPLHMAAQNGHNESARALLYAGSTPNAKNSYGDTPLHTAARYGHAGVTRIFISARCKVNEQNKNGDTALHISCALKRKKIAKLLVESKIGVSVKNKQNETALDVAKRKESHEIVETIMSQSKLAKQKKKDKKKRETQGSFEGHLEEVQPSTVAAQQPVKKEKKGLFFKKRSKSKDKAEGNKENRETRATNAVSRAGSGDPPKPASETSSQSDYNTQMEPTELLKGFKDYQRFRHKVKNQGTSTGMMSKEEAKKLGLLSQYQSRPGVQYYQDLAGNVKQGPIGFAPVCHCPVHPAPGPTYDYLPHHHPNYMQHPPPHHPHHPPMPGHDYMNHPMHDYSMYMSTYGVPHYPPHHPVHQGHPPPQQCSCPHCQAVSRPFEDYHLDHPYQPHRGQHYAVPPPQGNLFRSRSDETLSISSSHPSRKHWKLRSARPAPKRAAVMANHLRQVPLESHRHPPQGQGQVPDHAAGLNGQGRSPEGQSSNEYGEAMPNVNGFKTWGGGSRRGVDNQVKDRRVVDSDEESSDDEDDNEQEAEVLKKDFEKLTVRDHPKTAVQSSIKVTKLPSTSSPITQQTVVQGSSVKGPTTTVEVHAPPPGAPFNSPDSLPVKSASPQVRGNSPNVSNLTSECSSRLTSPIALAAGPPGFPIQHNKQDSGSNPDSGYSSKNYNPIKPPTSVRPGFPTHSTSPQSFLPPSQMSRGQAPPNYVNYGPPTDMQRTQNAPGIQNRNNGYSPYTAHPPQSSVLPKVLQKGRGYSSDGNPGMRRPKQESYASDNCAGMRMKPNNGAASNQPYYRSLLKDWVEQKQNPRTIYEEGGPRSNQGQYYPSQRPPVQQRPPAMQGSANGQPSQNMEPRQQPSQNSSNLRATDFWPGKATQV